MKYKGYKVIFKKDKESKAYTSKRHCEAMIKLTGDKGEIIEAELEYWGNEIQQEASYIMAQHEERCIICMNTSYIEYDDGQFKLFTSGAWDRELIKRSNSHDDLKKNSYNYIREHCKYCHVGSKLKAANKAWIIGYVKTNELHVYRRQG